MAKQWNAETFCDAVERRHGETAVVAVHRILEWAKQHGLAINWGAGETVGTFRPEFQHRRTVYKIFSVESGKGFETRFPLWAKIAPFENTSKREELLRKLNDIADVNLPADAINRQCFIRCGVLTNPGSLSQLLDTMDWVVQEIRAVQ